jgi:hypothetical protein
MIAKANVFFLTDAQEPKGSGEWKLWNLMKHTFISSISEFAIYSQVNKTNNG